MLVNTILGKVDSLVEEYGLDLKANSMTRLGLLVDVFVSHVRYGTNVADYFLYKFYNLKHRARKTYMTQWDRMYLMNYVNGMKHFDLFEDKRLFVEAYGKYMGRSTCVMGDGEEAYLRWLESNPADKYIFKPAGGCCGKGIFVLTKDSEKLRDYAWLMEQDEELVAEPFIENCEEMKKLHPGTLNTLRICTVRKDDKSVIVGTYLRIGVAGRDTDNYNNGGIVVEVDQETGTVVSAGVNRKSKWFAFHPDSGEQLVGFRIPMWEECKALTLEVADVTPEVIYSGWDIAVLPTGPVLIEGNIGGDVDIQQAHGKGKRGTYEFLLPKRKWHFGFSKVAKPMTKHFEAKELLEQAK